MGSLVFIVMRANQGFVLGVLVIAIAWEAASAQFIDGYDINCQGEPCGMEIRYRYDGLDCSLILDNQGNLIKTQLCDLPNTKGTKPIRLQRKWSEWDALIHPI